MMECPSTTAFVHCVMHELELNPLLTLFERKTESIVNDLQGHLALS